MHQEWLFLHDVRTVEAEARASRAMHLRAVAELQRRERVARRAARPVRGTWWRRATARLSTAGQTGAVPCPTC